MLPKFADAIAAAVMQGGIVERRLTIVQRNSIHVLMEPRALRPATVTGAIFFGFFVKGSHIYKPKKWTLILREHPGNTPVTPR